MIVRCNEVVQSLLEKGGDASFPNVSDTTQRPMWRESGHGTTVKLFTESVSLGIR